METPYMTAVFNHDLRSVRGNPHRVETPFGTAEAVSIGNALEELHDAETLNGRLVAALTGMCDAYVALLVMKAEDPSRFQEPDSPYGIAKRLLADIARTG